MDRQDLRETSTPVWDEFCDALGLDPDKCNSDFLICSEEKARAGRVFDDADAVFPTEEQCEAALAEAVLTIKKAGIRAAYAESLEDAMVPYSKEERETWPIQESEAALFLADSSEPVPLITGIAAGKGVTVAVLAAKIEENAAAYKEACGLILGMQQKEVTDA